MGNRKVNGYSGGRIQPVCVIEMSEAFEEHKYYLRSTHTNPSLLSPPPCCRQLLFYSQGARGGDLGRVVGAGRARNVPGQAAGTQLQERQKTGQRQRGLPQVQAGPGPPGSRPQ